MYTKDVLRSAAVFFQGVLKAATVSPATFQGTLRYVETAPNQLGLPSSITGARYGDPANDGVQVAFANILYIINQQNSAVASNTLSAIGAQARTGYQAALNLLRSAAPSQATIQRIPAQVWAVARRAVHGEPHPNPPPVLHDAVRAIIEWQAPAVVMVEPGRPPPARPAPAVLTQGPSNPIALDAIPERIWDIARAALRGDARAADFMAAVQTNANRGDLRAQVTLEEFHEVVAALTEKRAPSHVVAPPFLGTPPAPNATLAGIPASVWDVARHALGGDAGAADYLARVRNSAQQGDPQSKVMMGQIRYAIAALSSGARVAPASFSGDGVASGPVSLSNTAMPLVDPTLPYADPAPGNLVQELANEAAALFQGDGIFSGNYTPAQANALFAYFLNVSRLAETGNWAQTAGYASSMLSQLRNIPPRLASLQSGQTNGWDAISSTVANILAGARIGQANPSQRSTILSQLNQLGKQGAGQANQFMGGQGNAPFAPSSNKMAPNTPPGQAIEKGQSYLKRKAWAVARGALNGNANAANYLATERNKAHGGNWLAQQFLTYAQSFIKQMGGDVSIATWAGDSSFGTENDPIQDAAISLVNRSRRGDQNAQAALALLRPTAKKGSFKAQKALKFVMDYIHGGKEATFGAARKAAKKVTVKKAQAKVASHPAAVRHPALAKSPLQITHTPAGSVLGVGKSVGTSSTAAKARTKGQAHVMQYHAQAQQNQGGGGSGDSGDSGGSQDNSSQDDSSQDPSQNQNGDQGLNPTTGQDDNPEATRLVNAARSGDKEAAATIRQTMRADASGDPRARVLADGIRKYTAAHADVAGDMLEGRAIHLSHSHPLTPKRVNEIGASFGSEEEKKKFEHHVKNPHGPAKKDKAAFVGQIVGRAQIHQAARYPGAPLFDLNPRLATEFLEKPEARTPQAREEFRKREEKRKEEEKKKPKHK